jgi:hypothetical protein
MNPWELSSHKPFPQCARLLRDPTRDEHLLFREERFMSKIASNAESPLHLFELL